MATMVTGVLVASMATAISVMLRATPLAETRFAESQDITFLQSWIPADLSSAVLSVDDPDDSAVKALLVSQRPNVSYTADLPGTNVLTLVIPDLDTDGYQVISYRYLQVGDGWQLARYRITSPGTGVEDVSVVGVAHEIPAPPPGWTPDQKPLHAFEVTARNQAGLRPVGENITVSFKSGGEFSTGGAGLSAGKDLTLYDPFTLPDPTSPPTRCGGSIALVLDTSYSVPMMYQGGQDLKAAAIGFIDSFEGTPTELTVLGFDAVAYQLYPNLNGVRGQYIDLLNPSTDIENAKATIGYLPNRDVAGQPASYYYNQPNNGVGWTLVPRYLEDGTAVSYAGTNWEDALHAPFFDQAGNQRVNTPDTVVFITDGDPNRDRAGNGGSVASYVESAKRAANAGRSTGGRIIGVYVGATPAGEANLASVVGGNRWNGSVTADGTINLGNAAAADYYTGSWSQLGNVLRSIVASQCGGTVTIQKQVEGATASGRWMYSTETGQSTLDLASTSSITFDYTFETGQTTRTVNIFEEVKSGYVFSHAACTVAGDPVPAARVVQNPDGAPGVRLSLRPDEAVSCTMVSNPI